jgi:putative ABC transport system substrate-binding protein
VAQDLAVVSRRRLLARIVTLVVAASAGVTVPRLGRGLAARISRIGWISGGSPAAFAGRVGAFRQGLRELGWVEGSNVSLEYRWAEGRFERLPALAAELVRLPAGVIVSVGTPSSLAVQKATATIPIVMVAVGDPVGTGLAASLARPGGNLTGVSNLAADVSGKLVELMRETVPGATRFAVLLNPANPVHAVYWDQTRQAAQALGVTLQRIEARQVSELDSAFAAIRAGALIVPPDAFYLTNRKRLVDLAARHGLPAIYATRDYTEVGGLMSYGRKLLDAYRRAASYVDRILKGARPGDLAIEQPTGFEFVVNRRTVAALGLALSWTLLLQADEVIE